METQEIISTIKEFAKNMQTDKNMQQKNANQFRDMYSELGVNIDKLGCIMLDVDGSKIENKIDANDLYKSENKDRFWINGFVAGSTPHVTLLYGLLQSGNTTYRKYVDKVLEGWNKEPVKIDHVGFFDSPFSDDPYFCIVAHLDISQNLKDANNRLQLLPHINTFPDYKAHVTIAYIKKDEGLRNRTIETYNSMLKGMFLNPLSLNYGK